MPHLLPPCFHTNITPGLCFVVALHIIMNGRLRKCRKCHAAVVLVCSMTDMTCGAGPFAE